MTTKFGLIFFIFIILLTRIFIISINNQEILIIHSEFRIFLNGIILNINTLINRLFLTILLLNKIIFRDKLLENIFVEYVILLDKIYFEMSCNGCYEIKCKNKIEEYKNG